MSLLMLWAIVAVAVVVVGMITEIARGCDVTVLDILIWGLLAIIPFVNILILVCALVELLVTAISLSGKITVYKRKR